MGILCVTSFFSCSKEFALDRKQSGFIKFSTNKFNSNKVTKLLRSFKTPSGVLKNFKANLWPAPDSIVTGEKRWLEKSINYSGRGQNKVETFAHKMSIHQVPDWLVREQKPVCSALDGCLHLSPWSGHRDDVPVMASCCANVCDVGPTCGHSWDMVWQAVLWTCSSRSDMRPAGQTGKPHPPETRQVCAPVWGMGGRPRRILWQYCDRHESKVCTVLQSFWMYL